MLSSISNTSTLYNPNLENKNIKNQNLSFNQNLVKDKSQAISEILGYGVDNEGFFTSDFNEAASLPKDFRIYAKDIENLVNSYKNKDIFTSIDIAKSVQNVYRIFSQLNINSENKDFLSTAELQSMSLVGYEIDIKNLTVLKTYNNYDEFYTKMMNSNANLLGHLPRSLNFTFSNWFETNKDLKLDTFLKGLNKQVYLQDDKISKTGLFVGFLQNSPHRAILEGKATVLGMSVGFGRVESALSIELNELLTSANLDDFGTILNLMSKHDNVNEFKKELALKISNDTLHGLNSLNLQNNVKSQDNTFTPPPYKLKVKIKRHIHQEMI